MAVHAPSASALTAEPLNGTFSAPVQIVSAPAPDDPRLFVVEKGGGIRVYEGGEIESEDFLSLQGRVVTSGEQGLSSMAFAPDYPATPYLFVAYAAAADPDASPPNGPGDLVVSRFTVSSDPDQVDPGSEHRLLVIPHPDEDKHYAGQLHFGPDGYLYISTGDGGIQDDPTGNAQNLTTLLGKVLRIDPLSGAASPPYYTVPAGNPFGAAPAPLDAIWSYGFRNPWRYSFDRATGDLVIADVGQNTREEIDLARDAAGRGAGENFGWNCREGLIPFGLAPVGCAGHKEFVDPVFDYPHDDPTPESPTDRAFGCAVIGGYVYRGGAIPGLAGRYLYTDNCNGDIRSQLLCEPASVDDRSEGISIDRPSGFGQDQSGELYVASVSTGAVYRLTGSARHSGSGCPAPPPATPSTPAASPLASSISGSKLRAAIRRCKRRYKDAKRRKCIAKARRRAKDPR
jgi:glucose/arabinose dehydrogenase